MDERSARRNQETGCQNDLRGLSASQPRMRADTDDGPEQIAPLQRPDTLMQLSRSSILEVHLVPHGRAIHFGTKRTYQHVSHLSAFGGKRTSPDMRAAGHRVLWRFYRVLPEFSGSTEYYEVSGSTEFSGIEFVGSTEFSKHRVWAGAIPTL